MIHLSMPEIESNPWVTKKDFVQNSYPWVSFYGTTTNLVER